MTRIWMLALMALLVSSCIDHYDVFNPLPLDYGDQRSLKIEVSEVRIEQTYRPKAEEPYIDYAMAVPPIDAVTVLLEQRLQAVGDVESVRVVIVDASVKQEALEISGGIEGYFTREPEARLVGRIEVRLEHVNDQGETMKTVRIANSRSDGIQEGIGYAERQQIGYELVKDVVDDFSRALEINLEEHFDAILLR